MCQRCITPVPLWDVIAPDRLWGMEGSLGLLVR